MRWIYSHLAAANWRFKGIMVTWYLRSLGCSVGKGLRCVGWPTFREIPKKNFSLGNRVAIGKGVVFEITPQGALTMGDHVTIGDYSRISSTSVVTVGRATLVAEHVSIRGSAHDLGKGREIRLQGSTDAPIAIGDDVLIGAFTVVMQGARINNGVVIGANSIVRRTDKLHDDGIFAGFPLKLIRNRL